MYIHTCMHIHNIPANSDVVYIYIYTNMYIIPTQMVWCGCRIGTNICVSATYRWRDSFLWVNYVSHMTHNVSYASIVYSYVPYDSSVCVVSLIHMIIVTWNTRDMTDWYMWHDSCVCEMNQSYVWRDSFACVIWCVICETCFIDTALFMHSTWLILTCGITHSYMWSDTCVTWSGHHTSSKFAWCNHRQVRE